jgi:hypothetical protein
LGVLALYSNTTADFNTAVGNNALYYNTIGLENTGVGSAALFSNIEGDNNTALGSAALGANVTGDENTACGDVALSSNQGGAQNTAIGNSALYNNVDGSANTAVGTDALLQLAPEGSGVSSDNIALGAEAGGNLVIGDNNIYIGNPGDPDGSESGNIRIGTSGTQTQTFIAGISETAVTGTAIVVDGNGQLGVAPSSARFKTDIKSMDMASEAILALRPVTFRYKEGIDPNRTAQFGLVAEEVERVNPDLVSRDAKGNPYTVRYDAVNAMLLNEFLKEHKKTEKLEATVASLIATVKQQAAQIQKVSAQLETNKPGPQTVSNNQ